MERTKYICGFLVCFLLCGLASYAQSDYGQTIYRAYINGDLNGWKSVISEMENTELSDSGKLELLNYYYGYIGYLIGKDEKKSAEAYIKKGDKVINELLKKNPDNAAANAYKGSFIGFKLGLNKLKSVTLGPQSMKYIDKAYRLNPKDVQAIADKGNMLYYAPRLFGGNKKEALSYIEKAVARLEETGNASGNWFYLNLLTLLAQYYEKQGRKQKAIFTYEKILEIEPDFKWVRDELYPDIMKSSGKK